MSDKFRKYMTILALAVSGGSIYLIPYIRYVFYDHQIAAMGITNQQLGLLTTVYAIGCMALYVPGGIIADKASAKTCIMASLLSTTVLTLIFGFTMSYGLALVIWFLLAASTAFVFWSSLFKTLRLISGEDEQGRMFGLYYAGNGITGGVVNAICIWATKFGETPHDQFFIVVMIYAASTALAAILLWVALREDKAQSLALQTNDFKGSQVKDLLKNPVVWVFSLVIFSGYAVYSSTSYFTPYLTEVVGITPEESGLFSIIRTYLFMLLAPVGGYLADKVFRSTSKWFIVAFSILAVLFVGVLFIPAGANATMVSIFTLLPGAVGLALYGVVFSIANEAKIPIAVMGTAVGIASIIGYTPDFFMATLFGTWLDSYGVDGYRFIFIFLASVCVMGLLASLFIRSRSKKADNTVTSG